MTGALSFLAHRILRLPLGAHEKNGFAAIFSDHVRHELKRFTKHLLRFLQIDNVYAVALAKDVFLHLGVPTTHLMAEVNTGLQQLFHRNRYQNYRLLMSIGFCARRDCALALKATNESRDNGFKNIFVFGFQLAI